MKQRCTNSNHVKFNHYGGRGIKVCDEWLGKDGFKNFYEWAMANGYNPNAAYGECTIDRIDTNADYCPDNCRWITIQEQQRNRRC
nr:MAG TPA: homing endonuclease [Caudoviricetes sp.]